MLDDCHAVVLLCFFFLFLLMGYLCLILPHGLTKEYIISIFTFWCSKHICPSASNKIMVIFIFPFTVIYKYTFYNIIMMGSEKSHGAYTNQFPFEHNGAQFEIISGENQ